MCMLATRCCAAWNDAIGLPNWWRITVWSTVRCSAASPTPTRSSDSSAVAVLASPVQLLVGDALSPPNTSRSVSTMTSSKCRRAAAWPAHQRQRFDAQPTRAHRHDEHQVRPVGTSVADDDDVVGVLGVEHEVDATGQHPAAAVGRRPEAAGVTTLGIHRRPQSRCGAGLSARELAAAALHAARRFRVRRRPVRHGWCRARSSGTGRARPPRRRRPDRSACRPSRRTVRAASARARLRRPARSTAAASPARPTSSRRSDRRELAFVVIGQQSHVGSPISVRRTACRGRAAR